jgi:endogenous inhibitor of DNA gyrase (YacG/DUF329 family)
MWRGDVVPERTPKESHNVRCPLCGHESVPDGAHSCPICTQRLYWMADLDYTELVTERTQGFTGRE